jgi:glycosyltransferase involved in cell wall biosynthesis
MVDNVGEHLAAARWVLCTGYLGILEALAHGRLVFATYDNPLKRDYLALHPCAGRGLVVAASPLALSGRMADYAAHPEQEQAELAWAEPYARAQTWEALARLYLDLYRAKGVKP